MSRMNAGPQLLWKGLFLMHFTFS